MEDWNLEDIFTNATRPASVTELVEEYEETFHDEWKEAVLDIYHAYRC